MGVGMVTRNIHVVSCVNAVVVIVLAARAFNQPALAQDKAFGWHETAEVANAVACGCVHFPVAVLFAKSPHLYRFL